MSFPKGVNTMKPLFKGLLALMIVVSWASPGRCHGVEGSIGPAPGYQVTALYDDGEPMSYAAVEIKAPDAKIAFQTGRTDRNGIMMFQPDQPGLWQAVVSDGMGHRLALEIGVAAENRAAADKAAQTQGAGRSGAGRVQAIITGLALIFGLFGLLYGWRGRQNHVASN
jgi:nickel transport protein